MGQLATQESAAFLGAFGKMVQGNHAKFARFVLLPVSEEAKR